MDSAYWIEPSSLFLPLLIFLSFGFLWHTFLQKKTPLKKKVEMCTIRTFTPNELSAYDNSNPDLPVYVAIKGTVFDVTSNRTSYPFGAGYGIFAGKDASRALATSSLNKEDCVPEWSDLSPEKIKILDDWYNFYQKKYPVIGEVKKDTPTS